MNEAIHALACSLVASLVLAACAGPGPSAITENEDAQHASHLPSRPVYLRAMKTQLATPRAAIGPLYLGTNCVPKGKVIWGDALFRQLSHQLPKTFRRDVQRAHYRVPPASEAGMTVNPVAPPNYVEVDMQVQEVGARLCKQEEGTSGSAHIKIFWQVYAAGAATPLYESVTQGSFAVPVMEKRTDAEFFTQAFSAALSQLLAERGFQQAVKQGPLP